MTTIVVSILAVIFALIVGVSYLNMQEVKKQKEKARLLTMQVRQLQTDFKGLVTPLFTNDLINTRQKQKITSVSNNFFVFQPVSDESIKSFSYMADRVSSLVDKTVALSADESENVTSLLASLAEALPDSARDCTTQFYSSVLPGILSRFESELESIQSLADQAQQPEEQSESEVEQENLAINDDLVPPPIVLDDTGTDPQKG